MLLYRVTMTLTIIGRIKNPLLKDLNLVPGFFSALSLNCICLVLFRHWIFLLLASGGIDAQKKSRVKRGRELFMCHMNSVKIT